jgi:putative hemolysin
MFRRLLLMVIIILIVISMMGCKRDQTTSGSEVNISNPASLHCEENDGKVDIRTDETGGQVGVCVFPDGSECDEWAYLRGECSPGQ